MVRKDGKLIESTWEEALKIVAENMKAKAAVAFVSEKATNEEVAELKSTSMKHTALN